MWYKLISLHVHHLCINKIHSELRRAITLTELIPSPSFSITNVYLVDINAFANFDEIPSMPVQDIEKTKCRGWPNGRANSIPLQTQFAESVIIPFVNTNKIYIGICCYV